jgi:hypothetical protein
MQKNLFYGKITTKEHLMKFLGHFITGLFLLFLFAGCDIHSPEMPTWDINIDFPLMNQYLYVSDLVDTVHFFQDGNEVYFSSQGDINSFVLTNLPMQPAANINIPLYAGYSAQGTMPLSTISTDNHVTVAYGRIESGLLTITCNNLAPGFISADVTFEEFHTPNGQSLQIHISQSNPTFNLNLAGLTIGSADSQTIVSEIHYTVINNSSLPNNTPMGEINLLLNQSMNFDTFHGYMTNYTLNVLNETTNINIDYPGGIENAMQIDNVTLQLDLDNEIGFACEFHGRLYAYNENTGISSSIELLDSEGNPFVLQAAVSETVSSHSTFILNNENGLNQLTNIIPTSFAVQDAYFIIRNNPGTFGFASIGQKVTGRYTERVPFTFTLNDAEIIPSRVDSLEISDENRTQIRDNVNEAELSMKVWNQIPIGADFEIDFNTNSDVFQNPLLIRTAVINAGGYDSPFQFISFNLTHDELLIFDTPKLYYKIKIHIHPSENPVEIHASSADYIHIIGRINMNARVEEEGK